MPDQLIKTLVETHNFVPVITADEAREFDRYTINHIGITSELLMECAGSHVAAAVMRAQRALANAKVVVVVGPGNNGADAIVASRHLLARAIDCTIFFVADEEKWSAELARQVAMLRHALTTTSTTWHLASFAAPSKIADEDVIIIDGIFGAGLNRAPSGKASEAINWINERHSKKPQSTFVISVDIPSGLSLDAAATQFVAVCADLTVTFGHMKRAHISEPTKRTCGTVVSAPIGLFDKHPMTTWYRRERRALLSLFNPITKNSHKGHFGHVLIYEGNPRYLGASRLAARAALRVGAGLVTIATQKRLVPTAFDLPEFMRLRQDDVAESFIKKIDAVVIGPGLSDDVAYQSRALDFINRWNNFIELLVLDADGLRLLSQIDITNLSIIATPHPKEAGDLLGIPAHEIEANRFESIERLGALHQNVIWILKGATTLVRSLDGNIFALRGELPILAAGGSGDVLSGAIAGVAKQTASPLTAALLAVSLQIEGALRMSRKIAKGSLASELADKFPAITKSRAVI